MANNPPSLVYGDLTPTPQLTVGLNSFLSQLHAGPWKFGANYFGLITVNDGVNPMSIRMVTSTDQVNWTGCDTANEPKNGAIVGETVGDYGCHRPTTGSKVYVAYAYQNSASAYDPLAIASFDFAASPPAWGATISGGPVKYDASEIRSYLPLTRLSNGDFVLGWRNRDVTLSDLEGWLVIISGGVWGTPILINDTGSGKSHPYQFLLDPSDVVHIQWSDDTSGTNIRYSRLTAGALNASALIHAPSAFVNSPGIYIAADDSVNFATNQGFLKGTPSAAPVWTFYAGAYSGLAQSNPTDGLYTLYTGFPNLIFYNKSTDNGLTWTPDFTLTYGSLVSSGWSAIGIPDGTGLATHFLSSTVYPGASLPALLTFIDGFGATGIEFHYGTPGPLIGCRYYCN